jgi:hypothetical protein
VRIAFFVLGHYWTWRIGRVPVPTAVSVSFSALAFLSHLDFIFGAIFPHHPFYRSIHTSLQLWEIVLIFHGVLEGEGLDDDERSNKNIDVGTYIAKTSAFG